MEKPTLTAKEAKEKLIKGNLLFAQTEEHGADISKRARQLALHGQRPYAIVVCCSDSRVIPEAIFSAGIGDLFVIRVAGNVIDNHQLGSIEYAADHLGAKLIVVLGHTQCGAVDAAIKHIKLGFIGTIVADIRKAIGDEQDDYRASCLNVIHGEAVIRHELQIHPIEHMDGLDVVGAMYHLDTGIVDFFKSIDDVDHIREENEKRKQ